MADDASTSHDADAFPWHLGVFDAHCHPTDTMTNLRAIPSMKARVLTVMATRAQDQGLVAHAAQQLGIEAADIKQSPDEWRAKQRIVPCFGWHPWFSYQMFDDEEYEHTSTLSEGQKSAHFRSVLTPKTDDENFLRSLPDPRSLSYFLAQTKEYLQNYPLALIGEVGLDKGFRIPEAWLPGQEDDRDESLTPGGREGRRLSPYRVTMAHQRKVLKAQLNLAGEMRRAVSVHGVQAHGILFETIAETWKGHEKEVRSKRDKKRRASVEHAHASDQNEIRRDTAGHDPKSYPPRVCLHSFSGSPTMVQQYLQPSIPVDVFFSFSSCINFSTPAAGKTEEAIKAVPDDKLLIESDLHTAGDRMDNSLEEIARTVCRLKDWDLDEGVTQLGKNWKRFVFGIDGE
ncbi:hypothetical protein BJ546DRAFT_849525 [Cryomyces antarcticus]